MTPNVLKSARARIVREGMMTMQNMTRENSNAA